MLENLQPRKRLFSCKVRNILSDLAEADAEILEAAIKNTRAWPANTLQNSLRDLGIHLGQESIRRHRSGTCSCSKTSSQL